MEHVFAVLGITISFITSFSDAVAAAEAVAEEEVCLIL